MRVIPGNGETLADIVPVDSVVRAHKFDPSLCFVAQPRCSFSFQANFTITVPWYIAQRAPVAEVRCDGFILAISEHQLILLLAGSP